MKKIRPMWIYGDVFICDGLKCNLCGFVLFLFICGGAKLGFISFFYLIYLAVFLFVELWWYCMLL